MNLSPEHVICPGLQRLEDCRMDAGQRVSVMNDNIHATDTVYTARQWQCGNTVPGAEVKSEATCGEV